MYPTYTLNQILEMSKSFKSVNYTSLQFNDDAESQDLHATELEGTMDGGVGFLAI